MLLIEIHNQLKSIQETLALPKQQYLSHYRLESQYNKVKEALAAQTDNDPILLAQCHALQNEIETQLKSLEQSNEKMIKTIDFNLECKKNINAGDLDNLKGLVGIGEYFGVYYRLKAKDVQLQRGEVSEQLDFVIRDYLLSASTRTSKNKSCLDYLCGILNHPLLDFSAPQMSAPEALMACRAASSGLFSYKKVMLDILASDSVDGLMMFLMQAPKAEQQLALRVACSKEGSLRCVQFLLLRTDFKNKDSDGYIDLLDRGQPSLQCALHRAVVSGNVVVVSLMLRPDIARSNDLLRQLLVLDKDKLTPVDYVAKLRDADQRRQILREIKNAIKSHQTDPRLGLTSEEVKEVMNKVDLVQAQNNQLEAQLGLF